MQLGGTLSHFHSVLFCQWKATGKMNRPSAISLSSKLLAGQLHSPNYYAGICGCIVGIVPVALGHTKTLIVPSEEFSREKISSLLFCGFAVNCSCSHFPSMLEAIYGIAQAPGNGMKVYSELSFLLCSTLQQASGVK